MKKNIFALVLFASLTLLLAVTLRSADISADKVETDNLETIEIAPDVVTPCPVSVKSHINLAGSVGVSNGVAFVQGVEYLKPLGDVSMGAFTNIPGIMAVTAIYPAWWDLRSVVDGLSTNDYAMAVQGQVKWIAHQVSVEFDDKMLAVGGAGSAVSNLVSSFTASSNCLPVTLGQLKNTAKPFYDRLDDFGIVSNYPWTGIAYDYALANIGQVKFLFSFDLEADSDNDGMTDGWEAIYSLNPLSDSDADSDVDNDGLTCLEEFQKGTNPQNSDTDGDEIPDGWEIEYGFNPTNALDAAQDDDDDELSNLEEYQAGTEPHIADTDHDGMPDGWEVQYGFNPLSGMNDSLIGWWQFEDGLGTNCVDLSSHGHTAYISATNYVGWSTNAPLGGSLYFNSYGSAPHYNGGYVTVPGVTNIPLSQGFTFAAWVLAETYGYYPCVMTKASDHDSWLDGASVYYEDSLDFYAGSWNESNTIKSGVETTQQWLHLCGTYDGTNSSFYIDGDLIGTASNVTFTSDTLAPLQIGTVHNGGVYAWQGYIADARFYTSELSINEIYSLMESTLDQDEDGLSNLEEYQHGTNPYNNDSDGDLLIDGKEVTVHNTDPALEDTNGNNIEDGVEKTAAYQDNLKLDIYWNFSPAPFSIHNVVPEKLYEFYFSRDLNVWMVGDIGMPGDASGTLTVTDLHIGPGRKWSSRKFFFAGLSDDWDGDGLGSSYEVNWLQTLPEVKDSDENRIDDGDEDYDGDGLSNLQEYLGLPCNQGRPDPYQVDTDGDNVCDGPIDPDGDGPIIAGPDAFPLDPSASVDTDR
ncbi:MAG: LamG-like jellyroll fold domain-containing protein, partial [Kiritimatiellia bacterium]